MAFDLYRRLHLPPYKHGKFRSLRSLTGRARKFGACAVSTAPPSFNATVSSAEEKVGRRFCLSLKATPMPTFETKPYCRCTAHCCRPLGAVRLGRPKAAVAMGSGHLRSLHSAMLASSNLPVELQRLALAKITFMQLARSVRR